MEPFLKSVEWVLVKFGQFLPAKKFGQYLPRVFLQKMSLCTDVPRRTKIWMKTSFVAILYSHLSPDFSSNLSVPGNWKKCPISMKCDKFDKRWNIRRGAGESVPTSSIDRNFVRLVILVVGYWIFSFRFCLNLNILKTLYYAEAQGSKYIIEKET